MVDDTQEHAASRHIATDHPDQPSGYWLKHGDLVLGTLLPYDRDGLWLLCHFHPTEAYALVRPRFKQAQRLYEALDNAAEEDYDALAQQCEAAMQAIRESGFVLQHQQTGEIVHPAMLYLRDRTAEVKTDPTLS